MRGKSNKEELLIEYNGDIPEFLNPDKLPKITREQVVWYNKTQIEQDGGLSLRLESTYDFLEI